MQADAEQAYTQAPMDGKNKTWIKVPAHMRTEDMPEGELWVMPLLKALYGHPQSGAFWERKCETALFAAGFVSRRMW